MIERFDIPHGRRFLLGEETLTFRRFVGGRDEPYMFLDGQEIQRWFSHEDLKRARERNELLDWTTPSRVSVRGHQDQLRARKTLDSANAQERLEVERRQDYIKGWLERPGTPRSPRGLLPIIEAVHAERIKEALVAKRFEPPAPSVSSLQKWLQKYVAAGGSADALVPQWRLQGNYRQRLPVRVQDLIWNKIDELYLIPNGETVIGLHREIVDEIELANRELAESGGPVSRLLVAPSYEAVLRVVKELCPYTVLFCRKGERVANARFRLIGGGIVTQRANEVWEIDDTRVDLMLLHPDRKTVIGRPWMTVVIDRHTRAIMSFVLSFAPPDTETALEAMRRAMTSKDRDVDSIFRSMQEQHSEALRRALENEDHDRVAVLKRTVVSRPEWAAEGRPDALHVDNGKHYNSVAFKQGVTRLGILHKTLPVLKPWYKGTVERLIGTTSRRVFHVVPGTTYASIYERDRETPPEEVAVATLAEAQAKLLEWVVCDYQLSHHRGIADTPRRMWKKSVREHPLRIPHTAQQIETALSLTDSRVLKNGGIELDGLRYETAHGLKLDMAPSGRRQREVLIRRDPGDLTIIKFLDAGITDWAEENWHEAVICRNHRARVEGLTLIEYQMGKRLRLNDPGLADEDPDWRLTRRRIRGEWEADAASRRLSPRVRAAGRREKMERAAELRERRDRAVDITDDGDDLQARLEAEALSSLPLEVSTRALRPDDDTSWSADLGDDPNPRGRRRNPEESR